MCRVNSNEPVNIEHTLDLPPQHHSPLLKAFTTQGLSELTLLLRVQEYCYDNIHFMNAFQKIVLLLYKGSAPLMLTRVLLKSFIRPLLNLCCFSFSERCEWRGDPEVVHRSPSGQRKRLLPGADEEVRGVAEERRRGWVAVPVKPDGFKDQSPSGFLYCSYLMRVSPVFQNLSLRRKRTETEARSLRSGIIYCQNYVFWSWRVQIIQGLNLQNCF